jgi:DUF1365 family protein
MRSAIYTGQLLHVRPVPHNAFRYPVQFFVLDLDELPELERRLPLFSINRFNAFALRDRDHLFRPLKQGVVEWVAARGVDLGPTPRVLLLTNLAVAGYVFNPVSFFTCFRADEPEPACVVAEISNTFGEQLPTLLHPGNAFPSYAPLSYRASKRLHVSPFFGLEQSYDFYFEPPGGERTWARIDVHEGAERVLHTVLSGQRQELTPAALLGVLARYPLMPLQVIARIHWQAAKLWWKGARYRSKPPFVPWHGSEQL